MSCWWEMYLSLFNNNLVDIRYIGISALVQSQLHFEGLNLTGLLLNGKHSRGLTK
jgi:hypothetical protein